MPILPENRDRYPANWKEIRARILERARNRCEFCGVPNHFVIFAERIGGRAKGWLPAVLSCPDKAVRIVLTIAHLEDEDPANVAESNLAALCQLCHNRLDAPRRAARRRERARLARACGDLFDREHR